MITALASIVLAVTTPDPGSVAATLQARVDAAVAEGDAPALSAAAVLPDGEIVCAVAGNAGDDNPTTLGCDTRFLSGSVGKAVTALVTANLVADRGLDLDAPISTWLSHRPWWSRLRNRDDITLRMLLNHSAGVPDYLEDMDFFLAGLTRGDSGFTPDETIAFVASDRPNGEPGAHYAYSDTHYIMVGLILEAETGQSFHEILRNTQLLDWEMTNTSPLAGRRFDRLADGHVEGLFGLRRTARAGRLTSNLDHEWSAGGLVTTPTDLARLFAALGDGGFSEEAGRLMRSDINPFDDTGQRGYGLGVFVRFYDDGNYRISHGGDFGGYRSAALYDSATGIALAVQANSKEFEAPDFAVDLLDAIEAIEELPY